MNTQMKIKALEAKFENIAPSVDCSNFDCSPRLEAVMSPVYIGIWLHQSETETRFILEVDTLEDAHVLLEDGATRSESVIAVQFETFTDALAAFNLVATELSKSDNFNYV